MLNTIDSGFAISRHQSSRIFFGTVGDERGSLWVGNFSRAAAFQMLDKYNSDMNKIMTHTHIVDRCRAKNKGA